MLRLTMLRLAGLVTALSVGSAMAADMVAPPPPPLPPPLATIVEPSGGFYLRGDVGVGLYNHSTIDTLPHVEGLRTKDSSIDGAIFAGVGAGYQFNSFFRADITGEYRFDAKHRHTDHYLNPTDPDDFNSNLITGKIGGFVGLANAYVDLGTWHRITPFFGAGIGFASLTMGKTTDTLLSDPAALSSSGPSKTQTNMAWAIHAGLGYDLTAYLKAEVAYRYLNLGSVKGGNVVCAGSCPYRVRIKDLDSHDLKFGLRYVFADTPAVVAPEPLMRKY